MPSSDTSDLLTIGEVAALFKVTPEAVRGWERAGKITAFRTPSGQRRFFRIDIEKFLPERPEDDRAAS